ncbi:GreA/GreB family elongation factor [Sphingomonas sp. KR1UV-12]|uniref:GreA/GreB family elongation factor n=1 Tax=Sphingomonas aurea TaxID=3063994 RepID=A0ABT9ENV3_9SPHN|nr:GreA/GreB family elongation factor [Sphingomonas sp. KR1UV-12]MDP1028645.1 GreA/GreB family elongation factor [Sphingomonas sp. KR1UV-12]
MSVAFRRESDEEHLEPKFELPIPPGPNLVTAAGPALLAARVAALEAQIDAAAEDDREPLRRDLRYWNTRAATAEVVGPPADDTVGIGSRVTFRLNGQTRTVTIVGHDEADADARIAYAAPLARALIGTGAGDLADFQSRADAIEILSVEND